MIMIIPMFMYEYVYVCMYVMSDKVIMDHGGLMLMFICIYVCMHIVV